MHKTVDLITTIQLFQLAHSTYASPQTTNHALFQITHHIQILSACLGETLDTYNHKDFKFLTQGYTTNY